MIKHFPEHINILRKFKKNQKGAALIETAIFLPILTMLVFGMLYFAQVIKDSLVMQTAAREGARSFAVYHDPQKAVNVVREELSNGKVDADIYTINEPPDRGVVVQKDVILSIPFADLRVFTLRNEVIMHRGTQSWDNEEEDG